MAADELDPGGNLHRIPGVGVCLELAPGVHHDAANDGLLAALAAEVRGGERVLDLGCGNGVLGIVAGRCGAASVTFADVHAPSVELALRNAARNGLGVFDGVVGDLVEPLERRTFELVLCNPPQTGWPAGLVSSHPDRYGGEDGALHFLRLARELDRVLPEVGARLVLLRLSRANPRAVDAALVAAGFRVEVRAVQRRTFVLEELDELAPGTAARQLELRSRGRAEFEGPTADGSCVMHQELVVATRVR